jgi:hypothetical protein
LHDQLIVSCKNYRQASDNFLVNNLCYLSTSKRKTFDSTVGAPDDDMWNARSKRKCKSRLSLVSDVGTCLCV